MKISICLLDEVALDITLGRDTDGQWQVEKLFPAFLQRPGKPHLSFFSQPLGGFLTPHFTAYSGTSSPFRRRLAKLKPERLESAAKELTRSTVREYLNALEPADLATLEAEEWTAHWVDWRVIHRWMRLNRKARFDLKVNQQTIAALVMHVTRHVLPPGSLAELEGPRCLLAIRLDPAGELESRMLFHFPEGVPILDDTQRLVGARPAGWYWTPRDFAPATEWCAPASGLEQFVRKVQSYLERFPRQAPPTERDLPKIAGMVVGYVASDWLKLAIALAIQANEERAA